MRGLRIVAGVVLGGLVPTLCWYLTSVLALVSVPNGDGAKGSELIMLRWWSAATPIGLAFGALWTTALFPNGIRNRVAGLIVALSIFVLAAALIALAFHPRWTPAYWGFRFDALALAVPFLILPLTLVGMGVTTAVQTRRCSRDPAGK